MWTLIGVAQFWSLKRPAWIKQGKTKSKEKKAVCTQIRYQQSFWKRLWKETSPPLLGFFPFFLVAQFRLPRSLLHGRKEKKRAIKITTIWIYLGPVNSCCGGPYPWRDGQICQLWEKLRVQTPYNRMFNLFYKIGREAYLEKKTNTHFFLMPFLPSLSDM